jgi:hypothetical protein
MKSCPSATIEARIHRRGEDASTNAHIVRGILDKIEKRENSRLGLKMKNTWTKEREISGERII